MQLTRRHLLLVSTVLAGSARAWADPAPLYRNASAPIAERVRDLLARMTLEEKVAQMRSMWLTKGAILNDDGTFSASKSAQAIPNGIGQIARPSDRAGTPLMMTDRMRSPEDTVAFVNGLQRFLMEQTRLGIPALMHEETAHGYLALDTTVFPIPPALGSTWDVDLVERVFTVVAREVRARGATVALSPVVDLMREPRYGRSEEFFGEDPHLVAQMGIASVRGQQGRARPLGPESIFCTLKHFVHGAPQAGLNIAPAEMSERTLRENYLVPFADIIKAANPAIIMPSYNEVEGVPSHASVALLQRTGRDELGFAGAYFSDYSGVSNLAAQHHIAATPQDAAVLALRAGVDADLPDGESYAHLPALVASGRVSEPQIDQAVARILAMKFEAGLFENPYADARRAVRQTNTEDNIRLARTAAEKAIILLKNDGLLPLDRSAALKLAVIGPNSKEAIYGGYSGKNEKGVGVFAGLQAAAGARLEIEQADGVWIRQRGGMREEYFYTPPPEEENTRRIAEAVDLARRSDVIVLAVGDDPVITREAVAQNMPGDRNALTLFGRQDELIEALLETGKPIIALVLSGRPLALGRLAERANALLQGWYLGQEGGSAVANVLFGSVNPGGKLTVSMPRSVGALPVFYNRHPSADTNTYVEGPNAPLFPFGFGLSYTTFEVSEPRLVREQISVGEGPIVEVDVVNTGPRRGDEVVQIYVRDDVSSVPRPVLELKAFQRVSLNPRQRRTLRFELSSDDLAFWDIDMQWRAEPGTFTISAGNSAANLKSTRLTVV